MDAGSDRGPVRPLAWQRPGSAADSDPHPCVPAVPDRHRRESERVPILVHPCRPLPPAVRPGPGAKAKRVPGWVFGLHRELRLAFLAGLVDTDGSIDRRGTLKIQLANRTQAQRTSTNPGRSSARQPRRSPRSRSRTRCIEQGSRPTPAADGEAARTPPRPAWMIALAVICRRLWHRGGPSSQPLLRWQGRPARTAWVGRLEPWPASSSVARSWLG